MIAQSMSPVSDNDSNSRKRVCKACDRCRLKKSKCDGSSPCSRCRTDNAICVFGERKKSHDKVYPKGYVEMLEQQQQQLVNGLQELYEIVISNRGWKGAPLVDSSNGHPLTHDILERLGALKIDSNVELERFEEDLDVLRQKLKPGGIGSPPNGSIDLEFKSQLAFPESSSPKNFFNETFSMLSQLPPTPPIQNSHEQASMIRIGSPNQTNLALSLVDPLMLHPQRQTWGQSQPSVYDENVEFLGFDTLSDFNTLHSMQDSTSHGQSVPPWLEDDLNSFDPNSGLT